MLRCLLCFDFSLCRSCHSSEGKTHVERCHISKQHLPLIRFSDDDLSDYFSRDHHLRESYATSWTDCFIAEPGHLTEHAHVDISSVPTDEQQLVRIGTVFEEVFARYADRPCLGHRPQAHGPYYWLSYRQLYRLSKIFCVNTLSMLHDQAVCKVVTSSDSSLPPQYIVGVLAELQHVERFIALFGLTAWSRREVVVTPINHMMSDADIEYIVDIVETTVLVVSRVQAERILRSSSALLSKLRVLIVFPTIEGLPAMPSNAGLRVVRFSDLLVDAIPTLVRNGSEDEREGILQPHPCKTGLGPLLTMIWTSGSTGRPKGVCVNEQSYASFFRLGIGRPHIKFSFTIAEARNDMLVLSSGGMVGLFSGEVGALLDDIQALRPSLICTTPRLYTVAFTLFQDALQHRLAGITADDARRVIEQQLLAAFRDTVLGDRVAYLKVGGAPCSEEVLGWMRRCWSDRDVADSYGASEVNGIAKNGRLVCGWRLEAWESYRPTDRPHPRGELLVRPARPNCYWRNTQANEEGYSPDGFYRTGDIVEVIGDNHIRIVDRKKHLFKLSFGEFVAPEKLETIFVASPLIDQICILPSNTLSFLVAIVVPNQAHPIVFSATSDEQLVHLFLEELTRLGVANHLRPFDIPRAVVVDHERFSPSNGQMSEGLKLFRHRVKIVHQDQLDKVSLVHLPPSSSSLISSSSSSPSSSSSSAACTFLQSPATSSPLRAELASLVQLCLEVDLRSISPATDITKLGLSSMGSIRLLRRIKHQFGVDLTLNQLFQSPTIDLLARTIEARQAIATLELPAIEAESKVDWAAECTLDSDIQETEERLQRLAVHHGDILLTGVTGFLGAFIFDSLLQSLTGNDEGPTTRRIYCLVRAVDEQEGRLRLQRHLERFRLWRDEWNDRIIVVAGDLDSFGNRLTEAQAAAISEVYHCAAHVNSVLPYSSLKHGNVDGTKAVLRFCSRSTTPKHINYISTLSVLFGGSFNEDVDLQLLRESLDSSPGYHQSKYVAEVLVQEARQRSFSVSVFRAGMISAAAASGVCNAVDFDTRLLLGIAQLGIAPIVDSSTPFDQTPVDFVADTIVSVGRARAVGTYHFSNPGGSATLPSLLGWLSECGFPLAKLPYVEWVGCCLDRLDESNPLHPLVDAYFRGTTEFPARPGLSPQQIKNMVAKARKPCPAITKAGFLAMIAWLREYHPTMVPVPALPSSGPGIQQISSVPSIDDVVFW